MSKLDLSWPADRAQAAASDGWCLAYTVDSGKAHAYYQVYPVGPKLPDPARAARHVLQQAQTGSKLHLAALHAITASRQPTPTRKGSTK